jgi:hypothetical protein
VVSIHYSRAKLLGAPEDLPGVCDLLGSFGWFDTLCLYVDRYRTKCRGNLRIGPLFSEEFRFVLGARMPPLLASARSKVVFII